MCGLGLLAAILTFIVYQFIYGWNNPEPECFYISGELAKNPKLVPYVSGSMLESEGVTPVHDQFVFWFKWMFINSVTMPVLLLAGFIMD